MSTTFEARERPDEAEAFLKSLQDTVDRLPYNISEKDIEQYQRDLLSIFGRDEETAAMGVCIFTKAAREVDRCEFTRRLMRKSADIARARITSTEKKVRVTLRAESNGNRALRGIEAAIVKIADHKKCRSEDVELLYKTYANLLGEGDVGKRKKNSIHDENSNSNNNNNNSADNGQEGGLPHSYSADDMRALVDMLCSGDVVIALIKTVFKHATDERRRTCLCMLIAIAEEFNMRPMASKHLKHKEVRDECREGIVERYKRLERATRICAKLAPDSGMAQFGKEKRAEGLVDAIEKGDGCAALGILEWAKAGIEGSGAYTLGKSMVKYLALVEAVAYHNPKLREKCVRVVDAAFTKTCDAGFNEMCIDIRDTCRDKCVETYGVLVGHHCGEQIMEIITTKYLRDVSIDSSHIRKMVRGVLDNLKAPFDPKFLQLLRAFLVLERVEESLAACQDSAKSVRKFLRETDARGRFGETRYRGNRGRYV